MIENEQIITKNSKIHLSGMEFYAHHGCFKEERLVGAPFKIDLVLDYDATQAALTDDIAHTVNYQTVYSEVKKIMQTPVNLLETLCQKILSMLKEKHPQITRAEVIVHKINPALGGKVEAVSVSKKCVYLQPKKIKNKEAYFVKRQTFN
jgi:dihydroneopterin aldolase